MKHFTILSIILHVMLYTPLYADTHNSNKITSKIQLDIKATEKLSQSIITVSREHPRMIAARAKLESVKANLRAADNAIYNPEFELDSENTGINTSYAQISQTIDFGDQRGSRTSIAKSDLIVAHANFELARLALSRDLLTAIAEKHTRQALVRLATQSLNLMKEFSDVAVQRYAAGDLSQVELDLAKLAYQESLIKHAQVNANAVAAREKLRALYLQLPSIIPELPEAMPQAALPENEDNFIRSLPIMRARQAKVQADRNTVELRKSERSWDPTIAIRGGREDQESLIGATITIPLNIRNTYRAEVEVAQQQLIQSEQLAQQDFRDQRAIVVSVTEQYLLLKKAWQNWKTSGRVSVNRQLTLIKRLWRSGDMSTAEYLVQLNQAINTQAAGLELRGNLWRSGFNWLYATAEINNWLNIKKGND